MYIFWLQRKKNVIWTLTGLLREVLNWPVKIFCAYFGHIYIFYDVLLRFFHVRCLNIHKFGNRYNFWDRKKILVHFDRHVIFAQYFDHIWPAILYRAWSCAGQRAHDSKCLNDFYEAYRINHILYKKFLVKPNWVKIRKILGGGQYCPPPWTWR